MLKNGEGLVFQSVKDFIPLMSYPLRVKYINKLT